MNQPLPEQQVQADIMPDREARTTPHMWGIDRDFFLLTLGALILVVLGLVSVPLIARRPLTLAPVNTPEGTVQRFYQAAYAGNYSTAYGFLSSDVQHRLSAIEFQQQIGNELKNSRMVVSKTTSQDSTATVDVSITTVQPSGIFSPGEYTGTRAVILQREGNDWKIVSGPFYLPMKP